ncbi:MAG TPA: FtsX-like permease family protein, partial [Candidatus Dormibacteraeota bacterium]|nr:FtsX-like permease family protein [Candidatus Dormibacteraeota bacterium]
PRLAELVEAVAARGRGAVGSLGGRQLARRPLRYSRSALLLILAVAFATYALADGATWLASQEDQAAYQAVADIRVQSDAQGVVDPATVRAAPGVARATPVLRGSISAGALRDGTLLAVDPAAAGRAGADGWGGEAGPEGSLLAQRLAAPTVTLPPSVGRLAITLDAALSVAVEDAAGARTPLDPATRAISVAAVVIDGDGMVERLAGGDAAIGGGRQRVEVRVPAVTASDSADRPPNATPGIPGPLRLEAIEAVFSLPSGASAVSGTVDLLSVDATDAAGGDRIGLDPTSPPTGWGWRVSSVRGEVGYQPPAGNRGQIRFPLAEPFSGQPGDLADGTPVTVRLLAVPSSSPPLPAIASPGFLSATGTRPGDLVSVTADAVALPITVAASVDRLAPLDPATPWLVVDGPSLALQRFLDTGDALAPAEWWLSVTPGAEPAALGAIRASAPSRATVVGRAELAARLRNDPVAIGLIAALLLGALAAGIFAIAGFLVGTAASTAERVREFALLEALGLSSAQLRASLLLEDAFLLVVGGAGGVALGLILAWVVLPFATLTASGATPVPPPVVVVPWPAVVPLALLGLGLLAIAVIAALGQLGRRSIGDLLRGWES